MASSEKCPSCQYPGAGKGKCEHDHIHCRRCPTREGWLDNIDQRDVAASGDSWTIYCTLNQRIVTVTAIEDPKNRNPPSIFEVPPGMYRRGRRMITVVVGKEENSDTFVIDAPLLTAASLYFENALKSAWQEGVASRIELADEDPQIFGLVNEYLHQGSISEKQLPRVEKKNDALSAHSMGSYCRVWLLAHYLQMEHLMNFAMYRLLNLMDERSAASGTPDTSMCDLEEIEELFAQAPMDSILRKFLVHLLVWEKAGDLELSREADIDMPRELVKEMKRKCDGAKCPLTEVRNYYVGQGAVAVSQAEVETAEMKERDIAKGFLPQSEYD